MINKEIKHYQSDSMTNMENKNSLLKKEIDLLKKEFGSKVDMIADLIHTNKLLKQTSPYMLNQYLATYLKHQIN